MPAAIPEDVSCFAFVLENTRVQPNQMVAKARTLAREWKLQIRRKVEAHGGNLRT